MMETRAKKRQRVAAESLESVPNEIWFEVFLFLKKQDLASMRGVCKRFAFFAADARFQKLPFASLDYNSPLTSKNVELEHENTVRALIPFPDGSFISSSLLADSIKHWHYRDQRWQITALLDNKETLHSLKRLGDSSLVIKTANNALIYWDLSSDKQWKHQRKQVRMSEDERIELQSKLSTAAAEKLPSFGATLSSGCFFFRSDVQIHLQNGTLLATSYPPQEIQLFLFTRDKNISTWQHQATLTGHQSAILTIAQFPNGRLASCARDGTIKIWQSDKNLWHCVATLTRHEGVNSLITLHDNRLASRSADGIIKIWQPTRDNQWQCEATLPVIQGIEAFAILPDGRLLLGYENKIQILAFKRLEHTLQPPSLRR
jgi:WD40 repeat protein